MYYLGLGAGAEAEVSSAEYKTASKSALLQTFFPHQPFFEKEALLQNYGYLRCPFTVPQS